MQELIALYHEKDIELLKFGCKSSDLANICLHKSSDAKFNNFIEGEKYFFEKVREDVVGGPYIVLTLEEVFYEISHSKVYKHMQIYC